VLYEISSGKDRLDFPEIDSQLSTRPDKESLLRLNDVLVKACANDPRKRYASAAKMRDDLPALERGERRPREKSRAKLATAALCVFLLAGIAFSIWSRSHRPAITNLNLQTTIRTEPPGALVLLDDHAKKSPATFDDLEPRKYKLRVMSPGYDPIETIINLGNRKSFEPPVFRLARSKGALDVQSDPPGAQFTLRSEDGQFSRAGVAPQKIVDLPTAKYALIAKRGDWEIRDGVEIQRGETARKSFAFVNGTVTVTSEPPGAKILVDGTRRGRTPLRIELPARPHQFVAQLDGWPAEQQTLAVKGQRENSAHFVFANGSVKITSTPGGATVLANGRELGQTWPGKL
jgi:PEGA domain